MMAESATNIAYTLSVLAFLILGTEVGRDNVFNKQVPDEEYDFIVIGGGTAGSVIASRLSEHPRFKVLLLEYGAEDSLITDMPAMIGKVMSSSDLVWNFKTVPQPNAFHGYVNQQTSFLQGKVIGGSSTINGMAYIRALPRDTQHWVEQGAHGWSWEELIQYYMKSEGNTDYSLDKDFHNYNGELSVSTPDSVSPINQALIDASLALGYKIIDFNTNETVGVGIQQLTSKDGARWTTAKAFLWQAKHRKNLHIIKEALVTKIIFNENKDAEAVQVIINGRTHTVRKKLEIILSAGAVNSPKILFSSGIGPRRHLEEMNITCISDLPVGDNFHDSILTGGVHFTVNLTQSREDPLTWQNIYEFLRVGKGPLAKSDKTLLRAKSKFAPEDWPDLSLFIQFESLTNHATHPISTGIKQDIWEAVYKPYSNETTITITPLLNRPKSRGTIRLKSDGSLAVDPNYFKEEDDLATLVEGMKLAYELALTEPFKRINATKYTTVFPNCAEHFRESTIPPDSYLKCVAKTMSFSYMHLAGSCPMGNSNLTVTTSQLLVKGVSSLRVADSSVLPQVPSGSVYATVVAIAEKAANMIIKDHIHRLYF